MVGSNLRWSSTKIKTLVKCVEKVLDKDIIMVYIIYCLIKKYERNDEIQ
jgi:branched-subunit amino acid transport protein AzlD